MRELVARGATLIVTVDCGTNSAAAIDAAREAGADVVVLDHHQVGGALPAAIAVVNPNREDDLSGQGHLCAAGVVFLALVQTARVLRERAARRRAARSAVAARSRGAGHRLRRGAAHRRQPRLRRQGAAGGAPAEQCRAGRAGARVAHRRAGQHLPSRLPDRPAHQCRRAHRRCGAGQPAACDRRPGRGRRRSPRRSTGSTRSARRWSRRCWRRRAPRPMPSLPAATGPAVLVTASDSWHPGIVGLLASRLKDHARRPAFAIAFNANGIGTGSGPLGAGLRSRAAGARGCRRRADRQGRRPRHGGGHHGRAREARRSARLLRGAGGGRGVPAAGRGEPADRRRACRPKARRWRCSTRWKRPALSAPAMSRRSSCCRAIGWPTHGRSAPTTSASTCSRTAAARIQAIAFRAADTALGEFPVRERGKTDPCRRLAVGATTGTATARRNSASPTRRRPETLV